MLYSTERFGVLNIATGGKTGYKRVRSGQGPNRDKYQGYTKGKKHTTKLYGTALEAAVELACLEKDILDGLSPDKMPRKKRRTWNGKGNLSHCALVPRPRAF